MAGAAGASDDPGARLLHSLQLQRQQQQEALQIRLQQQQGTAQAPHPDPRGRAALERQQREQQQRQEQLHYRQAIEPVPVQPADDAGTRQVKREMARQNALRESEAQRQRFDREIDESRRPPRSLPGADAAGKPAPVSGLD